MRDRSPWFFASVYAVQGLLGIAFYPIYHLQKEVLGLDAGQAAAFTLAMTLPTTLKPLLGLLSDAVPISGKRRWLYLRAAPLIASGAWAALAFLPKYEYASTLLLIAAANLGTVFSDVLCDAVMVEKGREDGKTGRYQALQLGSLYLSLTLSSLAGGWLAQTLSYRLAFAAAAVMPTAVFAAGFWIRETAAPHDKIRSNVRSGFGKLLSDRRVWTACLVIFLWNFIPYAGTSSFYHSTGALGFQPLFFGFLGSLDTGFGILGALLFWRFYRGPSDSRRWLRRAVLWGAPATLMYCFYWNEASAAVITAAFGVIGLLLRLSLMERVARLCPPGVEATSFALFMAAFNLAASASNTSGGYLYQSLQSFLSPVQAFSALALLAALAKLACWPLLPFLAEEKERDNFVQ